MIQKINCLWKKEIEVNSCDCVWCIREISFAVNSQLDPRENHLTTGTGEEMYFQPVILNTVNFLKIFLPWIWSACMYI